MEQLLEYRQRLLDRYEQVTRQFCEAVETAARQKVQKDAAEAAASPSRPGWSEAWRTSKSIGRQ